MKRDTIRSSNSMRFLSLVMTDRLVCVGEYLPVCKRSLIAYCVDKLADCVVFSSYFFFSVFLSSHREIWFLDPTCFVVFIDFILLQIFFQEEERNRSWEVGLFISIESKIFLVDNSFEFPVSMKTCSLEFYISILKLFNQIS